MKNVTGILLFVIALSLCAKTAAGNEEVTGDQIEEEVIELISNGMR